MKGLNGLRHLLAIGLGVLLAWMGYSFTTWEFCGVILAAVALYVVGYLLGRRAND